MYTTCEAEVPYAWEMVEIMAAVRVGGRERPIGPEAGGVGRRCQGCVVWCG